MYWNHMSDYFIKHFIVIKTNNEPDAKDAVLNDGAIHVLHLFVTKYMKSWIRKSVLSQKGDKKKNE